MGERDTRGLDLKNAIAGLYGGSPDDFVRSRDALAKHLRSTGDRESAAAVKALRKPSRVAWALNLGVRNQSVLAAFEDAVAGTLEAQAKGGDVRAAMAALRAAVRDLASESAQVAERAGHQIEVSALSNATLAVLGRPERFEQLRTGQLTEVPDAGGLDFLDSLPAPRRASPIAVSALETVAQQDQADDAVARAHARHTAQILVSAQSRAEAAEHGLREAVSELAAAEERVRKAEDHLATAREQHDSAQYEEKAAAAELHTAEAANAEAQRRLNDASAPSQITS